VALYVPWMYATQEREILMPHSILFIVVKNILKLLWWNMPLVKTQYWILWGYRKSCTLDEVLSQNIYPIISDKFLESNNIMYKYSAYSTFNYKILTELKLYRNLVYVTFNIALLVEISISCLSVFPYTFLLLMICFLSTEMDILYAGQLAV
jgi:hypothetical protein